MLEPMRTRILYVIQIFELLTTNDNLFHCVEIITLLIGEFGFWSTICESVPTCCIHKGSIQFSLGGVGQMFSALEFLHLLFCDVS